VDLVRSICADWERGDFSSTEWADPEIEHVRADGPEPVSLKGVSAAVGRARDFPSAWEGFRLQVDEYRELDDERVLVLVRRRGRGKTSGVELGHMQTKAAHLFHVRDGKVTRIVAYWDRDRALADLGLAPEGDAA
jgi:ketosteroid isomerase-like protein